LLSENSAKYVSTGCRSRRTTGGF